MELSSYFNWNSDSRKYGDKKNYKSQVFKKKQQWMNHISKCSQKIFTTITYNDWLKTEINILTKNCQFDNREKVCIFLEPFLLQNEDIFVHFEWHLSKKVD